MAEGGGSPLQDVDNGIEGLHTMIYASSNDPVSAEQGIISELDAKGEKPTVKGNEVSGGTHGLTIQGGEFGQIIQKQVNHTFLADSATGKTGCPLKPGAFQILSHMSVLEDEPINKSSRVFRAILHSYVTGDKSAVVKITSADEKHQREAKIHFKVPHHKNIVERIATDIFYFRGQSSLYIAMEKCDCSLDDHIKCQLKDGIPFNEQKYLSICRQIVVGLSFLHSHKVVHGDLKPGNVLLLLDKNIVKLCDFGLSRAVSGDKTTTEVSLPQGGTAGWLAPEVLEGTTKVGFKSDIFPLGLVVFYSLSHGKHPYGDQHISWNHYIVNGINRNLEGIQLLDADFAKFLIGSMLQHNTADRPTAEDVLKHPLFAAKEINKAITHQVEPMDAAAYPPDDVAIPANKVTVFKRYKKTVWRCSWNPTCDLLASCSEDSTARIWDLTADAGTGTTPIRLVLRHSNPVSRLDWNHDGSLLATGSRDGSARIWTIDGHLLHHMSQHKEAINALKWDKQRNHILSGSRDKTAIIWSARSGKLKQQFRFHDGVIYNVDWKENNSFASCSDDRNIHVCRLGCEKPLKTFKGHTDRVYAVEWDPSKRFLASCSGDETVKIWSMKQNNFVHDLKGHSSAVWKIKWCRTGPGSQNPNQKLLLASASLDKTVRLWEPERGVCLHKLEGHKGWIYSIVFSPDGGLLASGSDDNCVNIWNTQTGRLVRSYEGTSDITDVCWNAAGTKVGASAKNGTVIVLDLQ